ncbi:hypothetical protein VNO80_04158 [Phaseolus coccineus]|uniref:Disease resistance protein winged helix domain-containing protein n=1 Tax=Phaseolus coccineus TaxID=3886 RepID=A0AAN9NXE6_PHACN
MKGRGLGERGRRRFEKIFFQDIEKDEFGKVKRFKMHDLIHDLAQSVAEEVCCITNKDETSALVERKNPSSLILSEGASSSSVASSGVFKAYDLTYPQPQA